jgi:hypothetical protein
MAQEGKRQTHMAKRTTKQLALLLVVGLAFCLIWGRDRRRAAPEPIPSSGGAALDLPVASAGIHFLQGDSRWADDTIGGSGESLAAVGCTVCAVAMAASQLGCDMTPGELNAALVQCSGYTKHGWIIWSKVSPASQDRIRVRVPARLTHAEIDQSLQAGGVPIVKFYLPSGISHWVPIVGKDGTDYLIRDSMDLETQVVPLTKRTAAIASVRYVEKR